LWRSARGVVDFTGVMFVIVITFVDKFTQIVTAPSLVVSETDPTRQPVELVLTNEKRY